MNPYLLVGLELGPRSIRRIISRIDPSRYDERLDPERFSPREVLAHLADWEPIMAGRIRQAVDQPGSTLEAFDEGERAIALRYDLTDPLAEAERFLAARSFSIALVAGLSREEFDRQAVHPERGVMSAYDLANLLLGHDLYHIEQLLEYLP